MVQPPVTAFSAAPPLPPIPIGTMSQGIKATARSAEAKLQSAMDEVKQGQAAAISITSDLKRGAMKAAPKLSDATDRAADKIS